MSRLNLCLALSLVLICSAVSLTAQQSASTDSIVPSLVKFTGTLADTDGKPLSGILGVSFSLYKDQTGGATLWLETQNVQADKNGHYSVMLGAASAHGLPPEVFVGGEARWLGIQANGQTEQPRVLLVSVPYALKALDAETLGGKPASYFMAASGSGSGVATGTGPVQAGPHLDGPQINYNITCSSGTACKTGFVPVFSTSGGKAKVSGSLINQSSGGITIAGTESVSSSASAPAILGTSTGTSGTSNGVEGVTGSATASGVAGINSSGIGVYGSSSGTSATSAGVWGQTSSATGAGVEGLNTSTDPNATGIYGYSNSFGVTGSSPGVGMRGYSSGTGAGATAVQGITFGNATGFYTDSNVQQARNMGGWVKAMVSVNAENPPYMITNCFNSFLVGPAATTPPCGINFNEAYLGAWTLDFGFQVIDRVLSATLYDNIGGANCITASPGLSVVTVFTSDCGGNGKGANFSVVVF